MTGSHHYGYDDDESHIQQHLHDSFRHNGDGGGDHHHHHHHNNSSCDPCQTCQAMSSVDHTMTMCGGVTFSKFHPSNYFNYRNNLGHGDEHDGDGDHDHSNSPYLYSPSAPVGPTSCEYCGNRNTEDCRGDLPEEYSSLMFVGNSKNNNGGDGNRDTGDAADKSNNDNSPNSRTTSKSNSSSTSPPAKCHRPQLFFLKKRPPFATPDGWNPVTEYRSNLFEPPSSVEGMGRGWGEVRGHLGNSERDRGGGGRAEAAGGGAGGANNNDGRDTPTTATAANATTPTATNSNTNRASYASSACGSDACGGAGGGGADTEVSFSSTGGGGNNNNERAGTSISAGERSLSPVQWVSGLMGALSPS